VRRAAAGRAGGADAVRGGAGHARPQCARRPAGAPPVPRGRAARHVRPPPVRASPGSGAASLRRPRAARRAPAHARSWSAAGARHQPRAVTPPVSCAQRMRVRCLRRVDSSPAAGRRASGRPAPRTLYPMPDTRAPGRRGSTSTRRSCCSAACTRWRWPGRPASARRPAAAAWRSRRSRTGRCSSRCSGTSRCAPGAARACAAQRCPLISCAARPPAGHIESNVRPTGCCLLRTSPAAHGCAPRDASCCAQSLSRRGLHATALEVAKLALGLDPGDPLGLLQYIDYLALRAQQWDFLEARAPPAARPARPTEPAAAPAGHRARSSGRFQACWPTHAPRPAARSSDRRCLGAAPQRSPAVSPCVLAPAGLCVCTGRAGAAAARATRSC